MSADQRGVTLTETMVAVGVVGLGLAGLASLVPVSSHALLAGQQVSTATFLAEQRLEQARRASWVSGPERDCLGISSNGFSAPTSVTCTRPAVAGDTACASGVSCLTFPDEPSVSGFSGYVRTTRVSDCQTATSCGEVADLGPDPTLRLVTVTVTYSPPAAMSAGAPFPSTQLSGLVARK
jgi:prepilin-type N-terminal cleavage/methylation domain-containing protein